MGYLISIYRSDEDITCVECVDEQASKLSGEPELVPLWVGLEMLDMARRDLFEAHGHAL